MTLNAFTVLGTVIVSFVLYGACCYWRGMLREFVQRAQQDAQYRERVTFFATLLMGGISLLLALLTYLSG